MKTTTRKVETEVTTHTVEVRIPRFVAKAVNKVKSLREKSDQDNTEE